MILFMKSKIVLFAPLSFFMPLLSIYFIICHKQTTSVRDDQFYTETKNSVSIFFFLKKKYEKQRNIIKVKFIKNSMVLSSESINCFNCKNNSRKPLKQRANQENLFHSEITRRTNQGVQIFLYANLFLSWKTINNSTKKEKKKTGELILMEQ